MLPFQLKAAVAVQEVGYKIIWILLKYIKLEKKLTLIALIILEHF